MPSYGGQHYRTFSQAASAKTAAGKQAPPAKASAGKDETAEGDNKVEEGGKAPVTKIRHNPDGSHDMKHPSGEVTHHEDIGSVGSELSSRHGAGEGEGYEDNDGMDSDFGSEGSSESVKSILG